MRISFSLYYQQVWCYQSGVFSLRDNNLFKYQFNTLVKDKKQQAVSPNSAISIMRGKAQTQRNKKFRKLK